MERKYKIGQVDWNDVMEPPRGDSVADYVQRRERGEVDPAEVEMRRPIETTYDCGNPGCRKGGLHVMPNLNGAVEMVIHFPQNTDIGQTVTVGSLSSFQSIYGADSFLESLKLEWIRREISTEAQFDKHYIKELAFFRIKCRVGVG